MTLFDPTNYPEWASSLYSAAYTHATPKIRKQYGINNRPKYEITWEVPHGTRKLWIPGPRNAAIIRQFLREGDLVFNIYILRLDDRITIPESNGHRHWVNNIEIDHHWDYCDVNPRNFLYFT